MMYGARTPTRLICAMVLAFAGAGQQAMAAGIELPFITVSGLGTANSNSAEGKDAGVQYWNPAGMALLRKGEVHISLAGGVLFGQGKVRNDTANQGGTQRAQSFGSPDSAEDGTFVQGSDSDFLPSAALVGANFISVPVNNKVTLGFGIFAPGGGKIKHQGDFFGRYFLQSARIETVNFNPSLAYRLNDNHSLGFGVSAVGGHAKLKQPVDIEGVISYLADQIVSSGNATQVNGLGQLLPPGLSDVLQQVQIGNVAYDSLPIGVRAPVNAAAGSVLVQPGSTADARVNLAGFGLGYNMGYMWELNERQRIGLSFRSRSIIKMKGRLTWDFRNLNSPEGLNSLIFRGQTLRDYLAQNFRPNTQANLDLVIPAKLTAGYFHKINPKFDLMATLQWNKTSDLKSQCIRLADQPGGDDGVISQGEKCIDLNLRNSITAAVGFAYKQYQRLTWKGGVQFDQTPIKSNAFRSATFPDNDRWLFSLGANYQHSPDLSFDVAYGYLRIKDGIADYHDRCRITYYEGSPSTANNCTSNGGNFRARYENVAAHILGVQVNQSF